MSSRFDYPLPKLVVSEDIIHIETADQYEGCFTIKNTGGGVLTGRILSCVKALAFEPGTWEGNAVTITYRFNPAVAGDIRPGKTLESCIYVSSNGGEIRVPVRIKFMRMAIATPEGITVASIYDFFDYAQQFPAQARRVFVDSEFYMLLMATIYPYLEIYESLHKDANRERAMDNFFMLSGLKEKTTFHVTQRAWEILKKPDETDTVTGSFYVQKSDRGYIDAPITTQRNAPWLTLDANRLVSADYDETNIACVNFSINPTLITQKVACETVVIGAQKEADSSNVIDIVFRRAPLFFSRVSCLSYQYEDHGIIHLYNNSDVDLQIDLHSADGFVRFAARKYIVGAYYEIPFTIKLTTLMRAQLFLRPQPFIHSYIEVRTVCRGQLIRQRLPITIGKW